jgi:hypothetical protein
MKVAGMKVHDFSMQLEDKVGFMQKGLNGLDERRVKLNGEGIMAALVDRECMYEIVRNYEKVRKSTFSE